MANSIGRFPITRPRATGAASVTGEKYSRYETIVFTLAAVATIQEAGRFAGTPDAIDLFASSAGVDAFLADDMNREESAFRLPALSWLETHVGRRVLRVQDPTGAGTQVIRAVGKWAQPAEPA